MKITTLGTAHGYNTKGNFYSSTLFETNGGSYLIDVGCQAESHMIAAGKNPGEVKAVFITHPHHDHMAGILGIMKDIERISERKINYTVYLPEDIGESIIAWAKAIHVNLQNATFVYYKAGVIFDDGNFKVEAVPTEHYKVNGECVSYSFKIECEGKKILYSGDVACNFCDFPDIAGDEYFDLCICECTHYKPYDAAPFFEKANFKKLLFNHIWDVWRDEDGEATCLDYYKNVPYPIEFARDGATYELN